MSDVLAFQFSGTNNIVIRQTTKILSAVVLMQRCHGDSRSQHNSMLCIPRFSS